MKGNRKGVNDYKIGEDFETENENQVMFNVLNIFDIAHIPFILIGLYCVAIVLILSIGYAWFVVLTYIMDFFTYTCNMTPGDATCYTMFSVPIFVGTVGLLWLWARARLFSNEMLNFKDKVNEATCDRKKTNDVAGEKNSTPPNKEQLRFMQFLLSFFTGNKQENQNISTPCTEAVKK